MLMLRLSLFPNVKVTQLAQRKPAAASTETHLYSPYSYGKGEGMSFAGNQIILLNKPGETTVIPRRAVNQPKTGLSKHKPRQ